MRHIVVVAVLALGICAGAIAASPRPIVAHGVQLRVPAGWQQMQATPSSITEPRTLLVVGTAGVRPNLQVPCQVAAYRLPPRGAVVVIVAWAKTALAGGRPRPGRAPLERLTRVRRPSFECFTGRGAVAQVSFGRRVYQVNVLVGDRAPQRLIAQALSVARSFNTVRR